MVRNNYQADAKIKDNSTRVFAADMQKVVLLPRMPNTKETFFNSRLITFNETFAAMQKSTNHIIVLWHEAIASRRSEEVASAFIKFLKSNRDVEKVIVWMDNCTGQNKNFALYSAILSYMNSEYCTIEQVTLKYLVKGHTFMAADGLHGRIEQAMRKMKNVLDFDDFQDACKKSSSRSNIINMKAEDFYKFQNMIRIRKKDNDTIPLFKSITSARFSRGSTDFEYQTHPEGDWQVTTNTLKKRAKLLMPDSMKGPRGISKTKKEIILKEIVSKIKTNRREFWINLPENEASEDLLEANII